MDYSRTEGNLSYFYCDGKGELYNLHGAHVINTDGQIKNGHDARRLAACWNACEGASTDSIEELAKHGGLPALERASASDEYLRERLVSVVKSLMGCTISPMPGSPNYSRLQAILQDARTALAEAGA